MFGVGVWKGGATFFVMSSCTGGICALILFVIVGCCTQCATGFNTEDAPLMAEDFSTPQDMIVPTSVAFMLPCGRGVAEVDAFEVFAHLGMELGLSGIRIGIGIDDVV